MRHCVRWGPSSPSPKGAQSPKFSANVCCGQTAGWTKMLLGMVVGLSPVDFVFDGDPATPGTEGTPTSAQFLAHVYCGQTARWMKTPLGTEVSLSQGDIVLDGDPAPRPVMGYSPPNFRPMSVVAKRLDGSRCQLVGRSTSAQATLC